MTNKRPISLFHHMHKTGGSSLWLHLDQNLPKGSFLQVSFEGGAADIFTPAREAIEVLSREERDGLRVVHGHNVSAAMMELFPDREIELVTCLRYPPAQIVSTYNFVCHKFYVMVGQPIPTFDDWYAAHLKNFQTLWFLGCFDSLAGTDGSGQPINEATLMRATTVLQRFRVFVTECLDRQSAAWLAELGLLPMRKREKVSGELATWPIQVRLTPELERRLAAENPIDMQFYETAKQIALSQYRRAWIKNLWSRVAAPPLS